jgi:hypothetical protein
MGVLFTQRRACLVRRNSDAIATDQEPTAGSWLHWIAAGRPIRNLLRSRIRTSLGASNGTRERLAKLAAKAP